MKNNISTLLTGSAKLQLISQRLPEVISVILIVGCAYTLAVITWSVFEEKHDISLTPVIPVNNKPTKTLDSVQAFRQLSSAHLFGEVAKTTAAVTTKVPETKSNLILKGVLATSPMSMASAIIALNKNGPEDIYGIGDKLPGNVTIKEIHPDHVIIDRGGQLETLMLPKDSATEGFVYTPTTRPESSDTSSLNEVRSQILKDPTSFGDYALPILVKEGGKQIGYRLDFQKKGEIFTDAGLKSTDVITSINGIALDTPQKSMRALRDMRASDHLDLVVRRDGSDVNINLRLQ